MSRQEIRVIRVWWFSVDEKLWPGERLDFIHRLLKPLRRARLARKMAALLDGGFIADSGQWVAIATSLGMGEILRRLEPLAEKPGPLVVLTGKHSRAQAQSGGIYITTGPEQPS